MVPVKRDGIRLGLRWLARFAKALARGWSVLDRNARLFLICAVGLPVLLVVALRSVYRFVVIGETVVVAVEILLVAAVIAALITSARPMGRRGIRGSVAGALTLLAWDVALTGSFVMSFIACPIWFLVSILKNAIQRPGWRLAILRTAIPPLTLGLVMANNALQLQIAEANAPRVVAACEEFHAANGKFPQTLDDLVPQYLPSVPRAKYCLGFGGFWYWNLEGKPILVWYVVPPYGRKIYDFEERRWGYLD